MGVTVYCVLPHPVTPTRLKLRMSISRYSWSQGKDAHPTQWDLHVPLDVPAMQFSNTRGCVRSWIGNRFGEAHKRVTCPGGWEKIVTGRDENALRKARDGRVELIFVEAR